MTSPVSPHKLEKTDASACMQTATLPSTPDLHTPPLHKQASAQQSVSSKQADAVASDPVVQNLANSSYVGAEVETDGSGGMPMRTLADTDLEEGTANELLAGTMQALNVDEADTADSDLDEVEGSDSDNEEGAENDEDNDAEVAEDDILAAPGNPLPIHQLKDLLIWCIQHGDIDSFRLAAQFPIANQCLTEYPELVKIAYQQQDHMWLRGLLPAVYNDPEPFQIRILSNRDALGQPSAFQFSTPLINLAIQGRHWEHVLTLVYAKVNRKRRSKQTQPGSNPNWRHAALGCATAMLCGARYRGIVRRGKQLRDTTCVSEFVTQ